MKAKQRTLNSKLAHVSIPDSVYPVVKVFNAYTGQPLRILDNTGRTVLFTVRGKALINAEGRRCRPKNFADFPKERIKPFTSEYITSQHPSYYSERVVKP